MATKKAGVKARTKLQAPPRAVPKKTTPGRQAKAPTAKKAAPPAVVRTPNLDVERWFATRKLKTEKMVRRVRDIILGADPRISDVVEHRTVQFVYQNTLAGFVALSRPTVSLMFNVGASIPGRFPHLEGTGRNARFMRFADLAEVNRRAGELGRIVAAWCRLQDG